MWNHYRLPKTIIPSAYELYLEPIIDESIINGEVNIKVNIWEASQYVILHGKNIKVKIAEIIQKSQKIRVSEILYDLKLEFIYLLCEKKLEAEETIINIKYQTDIRDDMYGCYKSNYVDVNKKSHIVLATQFEPIHARSVFPCFDEPQLKANISLILDINKEFGAFSNMPQYKRISVNSNIDRIYFQNTPKMSTYTFAFVIGEYSTCVANKRRLSVISYPEMLGTTDLALHVGVSSMETYEKILNIKYTLPKLDLIMVPESDAGAMENWGLVTFRKSGLTVYDKYSSESDKFYVADTISHELAHQFFGNLCTTNWWDTIWLNEGIATYFEYLGLAGSVPEWKTWDTFIFRVQQEAMDKDKFILSHPLNNELYDNDGIDEMFDLITYDKGGSIMYMIADIIGAPILYEGLHNYLIQCSYGNGTPEILWNNIETVSKRNGIDLPISEMMKTWTYQAGFPLVTVEEYPTGIILKQERYQPFKDKESDELWWISVKINCSDGSQLRVNFNTKESDFVPLDTTWYQINHNYHGFFRTNYHIETIEKIITNKTLTSINRSGLINDVLTLSLDGKFPIDSALLVTYKILSKEREYNVWMSAIGSLYKLGNLFADHQCLKYYQSYIFLLLKDVNEWIWESNDHSTILLRKEIITLAILFDEPNISLVCDKLFTDWLYGNNIIPPDLQYAIFGNAVRTMGDFAIEILFKLYLKETNEIQRNRYLFSLTTTKSIDLIKFLLDISLNPNIINPENKINLLILLGVNPFGKQLTWEFIKNNWDKLDIRGQSIVNLLETIVGSFSTEELYNDAIQFFGSHPDVAKTSTKISLENIIYNIKWKSIYIDNICTWLQTFLQTV